MINLEGDNMKVKLFSHNDLDGVGAVVVGKKAFGDSLNYECCAYHNIDERVYNFIKSDDFDNTDVIFITDISVKEPEVIELIEEKAKNKLMLIDHHGTAEHLNEYSWAQVSEMETYYDANLTETERISSGTTAFYTFLVENGFLAPSDELFDFTEQVRSWDSWDWTRTNPQNTTAKQLNSLHVLIGHYKFIERFSKNPEVIFNATERALLDVEQRRINSVIYQKKRDVIKRDLVLNKDTFRVGVVFADNYHSELGNEIALDNPDIDFVILINGGTRLSFRGVDEGIDLGQIAKEFGGGGHPMAAGAVLTDDVRKKLIDVVFNAPEGL